MKTREQIYGQEAAGILRDVSMYRALTEMQLLKLYPHKESKIRNLLSYLQKQGRIMQRGEYYRIPADAEESIDYGLSKAVWVLTDFMEQVEYGEAILRFLCDTQQRRTLDAILADGLHEGIPNWRVENDAIDSEGNPVLFAYTCDFPRIRRFDTALELHGMTGTLICFDYQEEALREICGQCVMLQSIDFQQFERSVLYS